MRLTVSLLFSSPESHTRSSTNEEVCYGNYAALAGWSDIVQPVNNQGVKRWQNVIDELINPFTVFNTINNNTHLAAFHASVQNKRSASTNETKLKVFLTLFNLLRDQGLLSSFVKPAGGAHAESRYKRQNDSETFPSLS